MMTLDWDLGRTVGATKQRESSRSAGPLQRKPCAHARATRLTGVRMVRMSVMRSVDSYRTSEEEAPADLYGDAPSRFNARESFRRPSGLQGRGVGFPWRTALVAITLFALGAVFITVGAVHFWHSDRAAAAAFLSVGSIAILPGAYASFALVQALRGVPGFEIDQGKRRVRVTRIAISLTAQYAVAHWDDYRW